MAANMRGPIPVARNQALHVDAAFPPPAPARRATRWSIRSVRPVVAAAPVGRPLAGAARADRSTSADGSRIDDRWLDTLPASRTADALGVDGAPAMVFTDSMPRYSACLDQPQSTMIDSSAG